VLFSAPMEWRWPELRSKFIALRGTRTQTVIADAGGLHQSAISKLENNENLGPAVEVFLNAVEGLGLRPSEFFLQLEETGRQTDPKQDTKSQHSILSEGLRLGNNSGVAGGSPSDVSRGLRSDSTTPIPREELAHLFASAAAELYKPVVESKARQQPRALPATPRKRSRRR